MNTPSHVKISRHERIVCGCCGAKTEAGHVAHWLLGPLCPWCSIHFDWKLDSRRDKPWQRLKEEDSCPLCLELGDLCPLHC